jgi:hypothetical protein
VHAHVVYAAASIRTMARRARQSPATPHHPIARRRTARVIAVTRSLLAYVKSEGLRKSGQIADR